LHGGPRDGASGGGARADRWPGTIELPSLAGPGSAAGPHPGGPAAGGQARGLWVREHLRDLGHHAPAITGPATRLAEQRRVPWWRP
ncbi:MAG: hypothetical protein J2P30_11800, partial [Actinobacteria bacterium]|nr:hypothetical protein [Actinomycetota bacterium]